MIIDKTYIQECIAQVLTQKIATRTAEKTDDLRLYQYKLGVPRWLRRIVFHPLNPVYSIYKQYRAKADQTSGINDLDQFSADFLLYSLERDYSLDTADFALPDDEAQIVAYVDNKIRTALNVPLMSDEKPQDASALFEARIEKKGELWQVSNEEGQWLLPTPPDAYCAFTHYGLDLLPDGVAAYIAGKDFVDCGAYVGDSAFYMLKYRPRKIYAFEPSPVNYELLLKTIQLNGLQEVVPLRKGLGEKSSAAAIYLNKAGSRIALDSDLPSATQPIEITTLDEECRGMNVGVIKMDIEGFEYNAVKGALETIRRDRPVLLISIYHTGKDFFEILPMLRSLDLSYRFRFIDLSPASPLSEKMLVAYPAELE